jgi:predicted site-specific integrase-resolvase
MRGELMMTAARRHDKRVGYIRVSSVDQNTDRQLEGQELDKVFTDRASGKDTKRPQLQAALDYIREGDELVVHSMDRPARNLDDLRRTQVTFGLVLLCGKMHPATYMQARKWPIS